MRVEICYRARLVNIVQHCVPANQISARASALGRLGKCKGITSSLRMHAMAPLLPVGRRANMAGSKDLYYGAPPALRMLAKAQAKKANALAR